MAGDTKIQWATKVWNPIAGCSVISPGCTNCYAMKMAARVSAMAAGRCETSIYDGLTAKTKAGAVWTGEIRVANDATIQQPLRWRKPQRVFVNSMSDLFHENVPDEVIERVFAVMALCPQHTFIILTKRPDRMRRFMAGFEQDGIFHEGMRDALIEGATQALYAKLHPGEDPSAWLAVSLPLPNVWLGISAEDQERLQQRAEDFLRTPAAVHVVSAEPFLGEMDFCNVALPGRRHLDMLSGVISRDGVGLEFLAHVSQVILGGESGPKARDCYVPHLRSVVRQCADTGTAAFVKQLGARVIDRNDAGFDGCEDCSWPDIDPDSVEEDLSGFRDGYQGAPVRIHLDARKGDDMAEWPADLRVQQFPQPVEVA